MASIHREITIDAPADEVWAALRDFGAVHERLAPGFVVDARLEGESRVVTFFNGAVAREMLVGMDDVSRRLAYSAVEGPLRSTHHNASAQVQPDGDGSSRFVWVTDVLPHDLGPTIAGLMDQGLQIIKKTLEGQSDSR